MSFESGLESALANRFHDVILYDNIIEVTVQYFVFYRERTLWKLERIADNIRYGRLDATMAEIEEAARAVRAHEFISGLPGGYEALVNEAGTNLSVGQKQLLSFARILLMDPRILILDEATASIDTKTERLLQEAIRRILVGRTSFVIAHRLSTTQT